MCAHVYMCARACIRVCAHAYVCVSVYVCMRENVLEVTDIIIIFMVGITPAFISLFDAFTQSLYEKSVIVFEIPL